MGGVKLVVQQAVTCLIAANITGAGGWDDALQQANSFMSKLALEKKANMVTGSDCLSHIMSRSINRAWEQLGLVLEISLQFHALALMDFVFKMDRLLFVKPCMQVSSQ